MAVRFQKAFLVIVLFFGGALLCAQDAWDSAFNLGVGKASGASRGQLGNETEWSFSIEGAYQMFPHGSLVLSGGYRTLADQTVSPVQTPLLTVTNGSKGLFGAMMYRHTEFPGSFGRFMNGFYAQAGLMYHSLKTNRTEDLKSNATDSNPTRTIFHGAGVSSMAPLIGVGFRFDEKLSLEINMFRIKGEGFLDKGNGNLVPVGKSCNAIEISLGIHP